MEKAIDLRSDTVTKPTAEMRKAMAEAQVGDDVYGEDPTINRLERLAAEKVGKEEGLFLPTGTMGNQAAVLAHTTPGQEIILHPRAHIFLYEAGGLARLGGLQVMSVSDEGDGYYDLEELKASIRGENIHFPETGLITMENTHNRLGGKVYEPEVMEGIFRVATEAGLPTHLDGARIFNAALSLGCDVKELTQYTDSVMFCLSKGLGAPVGSMLAGSSDFIKKARKMRKLLGGGMRQAGILAAAGIIALEKMVDRLKEDHRRARELARELNKLPGFKVELDAVQSNIVVLDFEETGYQMDEFLALSREAGVLVTSFGPRQARLVTHHWIDDKALEIAIESMGKINEL